MSLPWKLKPQYRKVELPDSTSFDIPVYPSQLVDEAVLWAKLQKDETTSSVEKAKRFVEFCLVTREVVPLSAANDGTLSAALTVNLTMELWELFFYGTTGKPEIVGLDEEEEAEKKKPIGEKSTGNSSSITPTSKRSKEKILASAQSA